MKNTVHAAHFLVDDIGNMLLNKLFRRNKTDDSLSMEELMAEANGDRSETANIVSVASDVPPPSSPTDVPV